MKKRHSFNWLYKLGVFSFLLFPIMSISQESKLFTFELRDQFKVEYSDQSWPDSILIFLGSNKAGNVYNHIWAKAIEDSTSMIFPESTIKQIGVANLRGLPFFLKGFIRSKFPKDEKVRILMDWSGKFSKAYSFVKGQCNILIFDRKKNLVYQALVTDLEDAKLNEILRVLRSIE